MDIDDFLARCAESTDSRVVAILVEEYREALDGHRWAACSALERLMRRIAREMYADRPGYLPEAASGE